MKNNDNSINRRCRSENFGRVK